MFIGMFALAIFTMFFTSMKWYLKLFTGIGEISILGSIILSLYQQTKQRRVYLDTQIEMEKMQAESQAIIKSMTVDLPLAEVPTNGEKIELVDTRKKDEETPFGFDVFEEVKEKTETETFINPDNIDIKEDEK